MNLTGQMKVGGQNQDFSLLGGLFYRMGCKLGLVRNGTNTFMLGGAIGLSVWGVLVLLLALHGSLPKAFSVVFIGAHVRLLVAIPLLFLCETWVLPRMAEFVRNIINAGLITEPELSQLRSAIRLVRKLADFWLVDVLLVLAAYLLPLVNKMPGRTGDLGSIVDLTDNGSVWVKGWYLVICLPLFRFLIFRWLWHLILWWYFLLRVERLKLNLVPTHPDCVAGLGYIEVVQEQFTPLAMAVSAIISASVAEGISSGTTGFATLYGVVPAVLVINATLFTFPLFIFSHKLWMTRITGLNEYMVMAQHYIKAFDSKWLRSEKTPKEDLLGTPDIQSLADLTNSTNVIRNMRIIPGSRRLILSLAGSVIIPLLPLLLLKYNITEVVKKVFQIVSGL